MGGASRSSPSVEWELSAYSRNSIAMNRSLTYALILVLCFSGAVLAQGPVQASSVQIGLGCAPTAIIPELQITAPVLGSTVTFSVLHSFNPPPGIVFASAGPPSFLNLGSPWGLGLPCTVFVDVTTAIPFATFSGIAIPPATFTVQVPLNPSLAGLDITFQAIILPQPNPFGAGPVLTNGVHATLGI